MCSGVVDPPPGLNYAASCQNQACLDPRASSCAGSAPPLTTQKAPRPAVRPERGAVV